MGNIGEGDADGIHRIGKLAPGRFLMGTEARFHENHLLVFT
jgi:hypothetical protein